MIDITTLAHRTIAPLICSYKLTITMNQPQEDQGAGGLGPDLQTMDRICTGCPLPLHPIRNRIKIGVDTNNAITSAQSSLYLQSDIDLATDDTFVYSVVPSGTYV